MLRYSLERDLAENSAEIACNARVRFILGSSIASRHFFVQAWCPGSLHGFITR